MARYSLSIILIIVLAGNAQAQEQKSVKELAEEAYQREEYAVAGALFQRQVRSMGNRAPASLLMKVAHSYQETGRFAEAAGAYRQAIALPGHPSSAYYAYGEVLRQMEQYDAARQQYLLFNTVNADSVQLKNIALQSCDSAATWMHRPASIRLELVKALNTPGSDVASSAVDHGILLVSNGYNKLIHGEEGRKDRRTQQPYYKTYTYRQNMQGNPVMRLEELAPGLGGKYAYHTGPVCMNSAEDTLYATLNIQGKHVPLTSRKGPVNGTRHLQLWQSVKQNGQWSELSLLQGINIDGYSSSHAALNTAGNVLYFVSDRPGGLGQTDIWYSEKQPDGSWGAPVNCGNRINTVAAETFPTVNEDGVLYFSSKGFPGLGGLDIYRAKGEKSRWEAPENMKAPFNSGGDDIGLITQRNGKQGYVTSNKQGGMGSDDIYAFTDAGYFNRVNHVPPPIADRHPTPGPNAALPPSLANQPVNGKDAEDRLQPEALKLRYDFNSAALQPESRRLLSEAAGILQRNPGWKLLITSFADSRGTSQYNIGLSALRSIAAINFLVEKDIDAKRLYYSNKGELEPVNRCKDGVPCNEEEYKENRRAELKVKT